MRVSSAAEGRVHDLLGRGLDLGEVLGALEGLRVDLVDVLGAGGAGSKPTVRPQNFLLTGMSDLSGWKPEWRDEVFAKIRENPQHQFLFLTKRPDLLDFDTDLENAWFGVTVTRKAELWRIDALRKNVRAKHYHVTFEPLFDDPGTVDLSGINWIVVGTMTGAQSRKIHTEPEWAWSLADQAHKLGIPVFMKEDLVPIIGDENMIQEMPEEFNKVLEVQKSWKK